MGPVVLINPNTNTATTEMMTDLAGRRLACHGVDVVGRTVAAGPSMITEPGELADAGEQVLRTGLAAVREIPGVRGIIVSAYADPGLDALTGAVSVPVVGIAGASMRAANRDGRRYGIATVAPALAPAIVDLVHHYRCADGFTGIRTCGIGARQMAAQPDALVTAMVELAERCVTDDGASVVIIGGGPLGAVAEAVRARVQVETISPIAAACAELAVSL